MVREGAREWWGQFALGGYHPSSPSHPYYYIIIIKRLNSNSDDSERLVFPCSVLVHV